MKALKILGVVAMLSLSIQSQSQENTWEPQTRITGYIATEFEYFNNLQGYNRDWGVSLSEAGLLLNYQPLKNITLKSVIVYRPTFTIDQIVNEASAEWKGAEYFKVKVGRFLTPLSPMNTYYYAPVNNSVTIPMIISHHEIFPLNMDAVSINGTIGQDFKVNYNLFTGGYRSTLWLKTGALGFFGNEVDYFNKLDNNVTYSVDAKSYNSALTFATGLHVDFNYKEVVTLGLNVFDAAKDKMNVTFPVVNPATNELMMVPMVFDLEKFAYGANFKFKYNNFQVLSEYWQSDMNFKNSTMQVDQDILIKGVFAEASNTFGKVTPYLRYEYHEAEVEYDRYTAGINYKPIFETTFKLEYMVYTHKSSELHGFVGSVIYSF